MKILHFTGSTAIGGVASIVYELSKYCTSRGHNVDQLSMCNEPHLIDSSRKYEDIGVRTFISPTSNRYTYRQLKSLIKTMREYDIVHVHQFPEQLYGALASMLKSPNNIPKVITTEHNTWNNRRNYKLLKYFDRWMYSNYDKIVCISPPVYDSLVKWLDNDRLINKITTITNGIDINKYRNAINNLEDYVGCTDGNKYIVMVGRLEHPKDPITLIKAIKNLPNNVHAVFCGDGYLKTQIEASTKALNMKHRVHLLGNVTNPETILKGCDVGVLSSYWDGFGLVAAEYMTAGIPSVGTNVPGLKEVIGDQDLLFEPGDVERLTIILKQLLENDNYRNSKIENGYSQALNFTSEKMASEYLALYESILS